MHNDRPSVAVAGARSTAVNRARAFLWMARNPVEILQRYVSTIQYIVSTVYDRVAVRGRSSVCDYSLIAVMPVLRVWLQGLQAGLERAEC